MANGGLAVRRTRAPRDGLLTGGTERLQQRLDLLRHQPSSHLKAVSRRSPFLRCGTDRVALSRRPATPPASGAVRLHSSDHAHFGERRVRWLGARVVRLGESTATPIASPDCRSRSCPQSTDSRRPDTHPEVSAALTDWQSAVRDLRGEPSAQLSWAEALWAARGAAHAPGSADLSHQCLNACHEVFAARERLLGAAATLASHRVTPNLDPDDASWIDAVVGRARELLRLSHNILPIRLDRLNIDDAVRFVQRNPGGA